MTMGKTQIKNSKRLPDEAVEEYRELYKKQYGEELSLEDAREKAEGFLNFFKTIHKPIKKEWIEQYKRKKNNSKP